MKKKDEKRFAQLMAVLGEVFDSGNQTSAMKVEIYFQALTRFTIEELETAVKSVLQNRKTATFPKPAEVAEAILGSKTENAVQAWALVDDTMRKHGNYVSVDFGDRHTHRCIELMGGWDYLGTLTEEEWKWKRKEFESLYSALPDNGPEYVVGLTEKTRDRKSVV